MSQFVPLAPKLLLLAVPMRNTREIPPPSMVNAFAPSIVMLLVIRNEEAAASCRVVCSAHEVIAITSPLAAAEMADDSALTVHNGLTVAVPTIATRPQITT